MALWRRPRSLRARLVAIVLVADALAALLTGAVIVWKARIATKLEIASAMQLGQTLVADTIRLMQDSPTPLLLQSIDLHFQSVRHVRITVFDADGRPVEATASADPGGVEPPTASPAWFSALVAPPIETKDFPILVHNHAIGQVALTSQPSDEVGEAWIYAKAVLITAASLNVVVLIALVLAFGRILAPLEAFADGLKGLESRNYAIRLPSSSIRELSTITDHFNRTAAALLASEADNRRLNRQLLTAQDDERRRTSLELHDEVGPCLFALEANATSIVVMAGAPASPDLRHIRARAADVVSLVERVQGINRRVLDRLRPMALGRIPLCESLIKLVVDLEIDGSSAQLDSDIGPLRKSYGFAVDLTVYRCVQEGLFNAIRHADADRIHLRVQEDPAAEAPHLVVEVVDDGIGLKEGVKSGRGLAGIRERVEALTGVFSIESSPDGTRIEITIPVDPSADTDPSSTNETSAT